jgi:hypothetical protein
LRLFMIYFLLNGAIGLLKRRGMKVNEVSPPRSSRPTRP